MPKGLITKPSQKKIVRSIRVLHISRVSEGGVAVVVEQLAKGLVRHNYRPYICVVNSLNPESLARLQKAGVGIIELIKSSGGNQYIKKTESPAIRKNYHGWIQDHLGKTAGDSYRFFRSVFFFITKQILETIKFLAVLKKYKIDLIHTHSDINHNKPEILAATLRRIPSICHIHAYTKLDFFDRLFNPLVDHYVFISKDIERYHTLQGKSPQKGRVIYNGIEIDRFLAANEKVTIDCSGDASKENEIIGIVGRIDWWKGHNFFIEALPSIKKQFPKIKALIIGSVAKNDNYDRNMRYRNSLEKLVLSLNLEDNVQFTGYCDHVPKIMSELDVLVHASSAPEPFGLVIIEGMAAGKPVVATAAGGVLEIIQDNLNGILVPCKDSQAIARAVIMLLKNKAKAKKIGISGRKTAYEKFSSDRQISQVEGLYHQVLKRI